MTVTQPSPSVGTDQAGQSTAESTTESYPAGTVRDATFAVLRRLGMTTMFGNPGSTELSFLSHFPDDFDYVLGLHESAVAGIAAGFTYRRSGPAVVNLHTSAGLGNAMNALTTAFHNHSPLVLIVGQQARDHLATQPFLYGELEGMAGKYVKWSVTPARAQDVPVAVERAAAMAMTEPVGPTMVVVPLDDWEQPAEPVPPRLGVIGAAEAPDDMIAGLIERIDAAQRPVIVAGSGVDRAEAWPGAIALAEKLGAPVWQEAFYSRVGFPNDHPQWAGQLLPQRSVVREALAGHDLVITLGGPVFRYYVVETGPILPEGADSLQFTEDPDEAAATWVGLSVVAKLESTLQRVAAGVQDRPAVAIPRPRSKAESEVEAATDPGAGLTAVTITRALVDGVPAHATVVEECPSVRPTMDAALPSRRPGGWMTTSGGGLGFGVWGPVGLALADRDRPVVAVIGDGSCAFGIQGLWTAAYYNANAVFVVLVNNAYGVMAEFAKHIQGGEKIPGTDISGLDFPKLAAGFGVRSIVVSTQGELTDALRDALPADDQPMVLDAPLMIIANMVQ